MIVVDVLEVWQKAAREKNYYFFFRKKNKEKIPFD